MRLEHLLTELLVATRLDGVQLETIRVGVHVVILGEEVGDWVEACNNTQHHGDDDLLIWLLAVTKVGDVLGDVVSHLWSRRRSAILVLDHTVMELWGHSNDHVIVVRVEVATLGHIKAERWRVVITREQVVGVVDKTGLMGTSLGELRGPHTHVGVLGLMDSHIWWPDSVMDLTLTEVPLLEEVTAVLLMGGVDLRKVDHLLLELHLGETLLDEEIVLLVHGTVATLASSGEDFEAATKTKNNKMS